MIYVHIGAGAGDLDAGAHFRDGFSEFVKQSDDSEKKIYVVEANPSNISKLEETWKNYKNVNLQKLIVLEGFMQNGHQIRNLWKN